MAYNPQPVNVHYPGYYGNNMNYNPQPSLYNSQMKMSWHGMPQNQQAFPYAPQYVNHPSLNMSNPGIPLNRSISAVPMPNYQQYSSY